MRYAWILSACSTVLIAGCGMAPSHNPIVPSDPAAPSVSSFSGLVHGGQQPINGSFVYLYEVGTGGFGTSSTSLLNSSTGNEDSNHNWFVLTNASGFFSITSTNYTCDVGDQVYLYSAGGNPQIGGGANTGIGLMAVLGTCGAGNSFTNLPPTVQMNEITTVAAAYALAPFATDATHMSGDTGASAGMANAAASATNIASIGTGQAFATTPGGNGAVPQTEINTLANILAACINSSGSTSAGCTSLFANATIDGTPGGTKPAETATAAIYIAHNPGANVTTLWDLETSTAPFQPSLTSSTPNDWTISVAYSGGGLAGPTDVAVDASGNVWVTNNNNNSIGKFSTLGAALSPPITGFAGGGVTSPNSLAIDQAGMVWITNQNTLTISEYNPSSGFVGSGFTGGGLNNPWGIAVDASGNIWVANLNNNSISEFNASGTPLSPNTTGDTGAGLNDPIAIAVDTAGDVWVANHGASTISEFSSTTGLPLSTGTGGGLDFPLGVGIDHSGDIWFANEGNSVVSKFSPSTPPTTPPTALSGSGFAGGGLSVPYGLAVDGVGNIWVTNFSGACISEFSPSGTAITSGTGYKGTANEPEGIAIDQSGNVWVANDGNNSLLEFIGAAAPVVTPLSVALKNNELGVRP
jgi:streptogramin lyase